MDVGHPLRERAVVLAPVEGAQLHHVVHEVDHGVDPGQLLLQVPGVLPQLEARHLAVVAVVVLLRFAGVYGLEEAGGLPPPLDQDQDELLLALVEEVPRCDVGQIPTKLLHEKHISLTETIIKTHSSMKISCKKVRLTFFNISRSVEDFLLFPPV